MGLQLLVRVIFLQTGTASRGADQGADAVHLTVLPVHMGALSRERHDIWQDIQPGLPLQAVHPTCTANKAPLLVHVIVVPSCLSLAEMWQETPERVVSHWTRRIQS